jgi:hypothetical protein
MTGIRSEEIERELPAFAPWEPIGIALPPGPRWWRGRGVCAWVGSPERVAAERAGIERLGDHPARPIVIAATERAIALAPFGDAADPEVITTWPFEERARIEGTRRELTSGFGVNVARALGRLVGRRHADRWLDARIAFDEDIGRSFGGVDRGWLRAMDGRVVCVRCDRVRERAWASLDRAGFGLEGDGEAFELARVVVLLREHAMTRAPELEAGVRAIVTPRPVERVRVWIEAPPFVDVSAWISQGQEVDASRARWLSSELDGLAVGGATLSVRTEPAIRAGKRSMPREDRAVRRRRLFSRWDEGIEADDEGLMSATPEALASRLARDLRGVVLDGTCGIGSIAIACARTPGVTRVIAADVDRARLDMAAHNARVYGVADRIELVHADVRDVIDRARADVLILDPPWGGRGYDRERVTLADLPMDVAGVLARFSGDVVLKLPRSFDPSTLPGAWDLEAMIDDRGIVKLLAARRRRA